MKKFPKIKYPNHESNDGLLDGDVVVTEKFDGANFRFTWNNGDLTVGTRNHVYDADDENLPKAFRHAVERIKRVEFEPWMESYTVYGEAMHKHSLDYEGIDWEVPSKGPPHVPLDSDLPNVVLFDARHLGSWVEWDDMVGLASDLRIPLTPVLERGDPDDLSFEIPDESMFGGPPEGIVIRRLDGSFRAKKVSESFKESGGGGGSGRPLTGSESAAQQFVFDEVTPARITKTAHKLVDSGQYDELCMPMMEDLPREVLVDAIGENAWDLVCNRIDIGDDHEEFFDEVRSAASKKCARTLKRELQSI